MASRVQFFNVPAPSNPAEAELFDMLVRMAMAKGMRSFAIVVPKNSNVEEAYKYMAQVSEMVAANPLQDEASCSKPMESPKIVELPKEPMEGVTTRNRKRQASMEDDNSAKRFKD